MFIIDEPLLSPYGIDGAYIHRFWKNLIAPKHTLPRDGGILLMTADSGSLSIRNVEENRENLGLNEEYYFLAVTQLKNE